MKKIIAMAFVVFLSACNNPAVPPLPQVGDIAPAAQAVQQHQAGGFDTGDAAVGALVGAGAGYMLGRSGSNNGQTVIDNRSRYGGYGYNNYGGRKQTTTVTTTKRSFFGGKKTVTRTTTRRR